VNKYYNKNWKTIKKARQIGQSERHFRRNFKPPETKPKRKGAGALDIFTK